MVEDAGGHLRSDGELVDTTGVLDRDLPAHTGDLLAIGKEGWGGGGHLRSLAFCTHIDANEKIILKNVEYIFLPLFSLAVSSVR
jgi:hypothetical protein